MNTKRINWKKVGKQLAIEFSLPAIVALSWTLYAETQAADGWTWINAATKFSGAFFLSSWAMAQVFRVLKQNRVDDQLGTIKADLTSLVDKIKSETDTLLKHVTGGDSYCFITLVGFRTRSVSMLLQRVGEPIVHDLRMWIVDPDELVSASAGIHEFANRGRHIDVGAVTQRRRVYRQLSLDSDRQLQRYDIYFSARNGTTHQRVVLVQEEGQWLLSSKVWRNGILLHEFGNSDFPTDAEGRWKWWNFPE